MYAKIAIDWYIAGYGLAYRDRHRHSYELDMGKHIEINIEGYVEIHRGGVIKIKVKI